ncbi:acetate--CoA ligase family protein [Halorussus salilacus]|uniref:acetate--CoA ligase family protein n=1 Tax=Halorussus salilacus TaxID=2953750 RepID=UPI00209E9D70|nr:acetate--CoA ligase [Halorussus salilacus]USZ69603.1 acetate--CoA ligase family protein [Halorussus salilacus]
MGDSVPLDPLFSPDSIAVVGASPDSFYSANLIDNLLDYGFDGEFYPVNPSRDEAWGRTCYDSIEEVPETVDLVVVSVPREYAVGVVREAGELGVPAALVITAGFAEADEEGERLQSELAAVADEEDIRVCGPNCIGLANAVDSTVLTSTCSRPPEPGSIGLVSQSGALAFTTFFERAADEDVDFAYLASTGNEADLTVSDYVEYMADQPEVEVICAYVEGLADPDRFMTVVDRAVREGTPVLTIKIGQSETAEAATLSHTGSLTGDDAAWNGAFAQTGVERVPDIPDLLGRASVHQAFDPPASNRVAIASTSGGLASLLADMAAERGLELPDIDGETERALVEHDDLLTFGEMHNPADIRGYGADVLPDIAEVLFADDSFDAYVFALGLSAVDERADRIVPDVLEVAEGTDDPVVFLWTGRKEPDEPTDGLPYERVREEIPLFYDPERCMDALASLVDFGEVRDRVSEKPSRSELRSRTRVEEPPELPPGGVLGWSDAESLLDEYGIEPVETRLATDADEAAAIAAEVGFPVAMKVDSPDLPHRTEAGAVETGIDGEAAAREAFERIVGNAREYAPDAAIAGVLVQEQVEGGVEALVGASTDEVFGPLVTVAPGGTLVELLDDRAVRVPPISGDDAREAVEATKLAALLAERRDGPPIPVEPLADLLERVGDLVVENPEVREVDLNPVIVREDGAAVVDVLVRTE